MCPAAVVIYQRNDPFFGREMGDLCKGKKRRKKSKKGVDKWDVLWYSNKAVAEVNTSRERKRIRNGLNVKNFSKKFEKSS